MPARSPEAIARRNARRYQRLRERRGTTAPYRPREKLPSDPVERQAIIAQRKRQREAEKRQREGEKRQREAEKRATQPAILGNERPAPLRQSSRHRLVFDCTPPGVTIPLRVLYKHLWERLRVRLLQEHGLVCMACGHVPPSSSNLEGHEVYSYPGRGVIRLEAIVLLCRKCHHAIHLERSVGFEGDRARRAWEAENPVPPRQTARQAADAERAMEAAVSKATTEYLEEMLRHYCEVNRVTRRQADQDYEKALPPDNILKLSGVARMDYGPYTDEINKTLARIERRKGVLR